MPYLLQLLARCRQSKRLIQSVVLAFVLGLGVSIAAPALQAQNTSPDTQVICLGKGGMKTIMFAADGTVQEVQTAHGTQCLQCTALQALLPTNRSTQGLQAISFEKPLQALTLGSYAVEFRSPPARAPPFRTQD